MNEYASVNKQLDWKKAKGIVAGVDIGAVSSKAVILVDGQPYAMAKMATRTPKEAATRVINAALDGNGLTLDKIQYIVGTGRGRAFVPSAQKLVSEIACGARGAVHIWGPSVRTVLDAGGESCRVIHCNEKGKATSFLWNDKCAAGIGRSMEDFADLVQKDITDNANIALQIEKVPKFSDFCVVYAQSEALDLLRSKVSLEEVIAGYHHAMAKRISTLVNRAGIKKEFVIIGGLAKNPSIIDALENRLQVKRLAPKPQWDSQAAVALGAALIANAFYKGQKSDT